MLSRVLKPGILSRCGQTGQCLQAHLHTDLAEVLLVLELQVPVQASIGGEQCASIWITYHTNSSSHSLQQAPRLVSLSYRTQTEERQVVVACAGSSQAWQML